MDDLAGAIAIVQKRFVEKPSPPENVIVARSFSSNDCRSLRQQSATE
jgi:hypothetical protein